MQKLALFLLITISTTMANSQEKGYELGKYTIPEIGDSTIYFATSYEETSYVNGERLNVHKIRKVPILTPPLSKSNLVFIGNSFGFNSDYEGIKVLDYSLEYPQRMTVYNSTNHTVNGKDATGYSPVEGLIFSRGSDLFFFDANHFRPIEVPLDTASLTYINANYYYDKNGLYHIDDFRTDDKKLSDELHTPILYKDYFVYGNNVYMYRKVMRFDSNSFITFGYNYNTYYSDGENLYDSNLIPLELHKFIINTPEEPLNDWKFITALSRGKIKNNTLYLSPPKHNEGGGYGGLIFKANGRYFGLTGSSSYLEAKYFDDVLIYNHHTKEYESVDPDQYRQLTIHFYSYKNQLYYLDANPMESGFNLAKLDVVRHKGYPTEFYTDSKYLLGGYNFSEMVNKGTYENPIYEFKPLFHDVDWATLKVISYNILVDKSHIYQSNQSVLGAKPIKDLNVNVIVK